MKLTFGVILIALSLFMLLGFFVSDIDNGIGAEIAAFLLTILLPFVCGVGLIRSHYKGKAKIEENKKALWKQTMESEMLKFAAKRGGKLTVVEVVSEMPLDHLAAKDILDSLVAQSLAAVELTESGIIVYAFYDLRHLSEKEYAKGVLDA
jgi:hypothetical protein